MRKFVRTALVALSLTLSAQAWAIAQSHSESVPRQTLATLDAILDKAPTVDDFLANENLISEYYWAARNYYGGEKFDRDAFDAILLRFTELLARNRELGPRAWEKREVPPTLRIQSTHRAFGRHKITRDFNKLLREIGVNSLETAQRLTAHEIEDRLASVARETSAARGLEQASQSQRFAELRFGAEANRLRQTLLARAMRNSIFSTAFLSPEADEVLQAYDTLLKNPAQILPEFADQAEALRFVLSGLTPTALLADRTDLFENAQDIDRTDDGAYEFVSVARRFHALFRGIQFKECVGGDPNSLYNLHEARFAIPLLEGGIETHVLRNGKMVGYLSSVEVRHGSEHYYSLDILTPWMKSRILLPDDSKIGLLDWWLLEEEKRLPPAIEGFVVGQSALIKNGEGLPGLRLSGAWLQATPLAPAMDFAPVDPLARVLVKAPRTSQIHDEMRNNRLMFDLGSQDAKIAMRLQPELFDVHRLDNPADLATRVQDPFQEAKLWATLAQALRPTQAAQDFLSRRANELMIAWTFKAGEHVEDAEKLLQYCGSQCVQAIYRYALGNRVTGVQDFITKLGLLQRAPTDYVQILQTEFVNRYIENLLKFYGRAISSENVRAIASAIDDVDVKITTVGNLARAAFSAADYLEFTELDGRMPTTNHARLQMDKVHLNNFKLMTSLSPGTSQWLELLSRTYHIQNYAKLLTQIVEKQPPDVLKILRAGRDRFLNFQLPGEFEKILKKARLQFLKLNPSPEQQRSFETLTLTHECESYLR